MNRKLIFIGMFLASILFIGCNSCEFVEKEDELEIKSKIHDTYIDKIMDSSFSKISFARSISPVSTSSTSSTVLSVFVSSSKSNCSIALSSISKLVSRLKDMKNVHAMYKKK